VAKNKGTFGKGKSTEVPETDEFLSGMDKLGRAIKPYAGRLLVLVGVIAVVAVGLTTWNWWKERKAGAATSILSQAVSLGRVQVTDVPPEPNPRMPPDPRQLPAYFKTRSDRAKAVIETIDSLKGSYGSTSASHAADLVAARALLDLSRFSEALDRYKSYLGHGGPDMLKLTAREGVGYALEGMAAAEEQVEARQAGFKRALAAFESMQPNAEGPGRDEALFHQARILVELGQRDDAVTRFEQILADHPDSGLKQDVELRLLAMGGSPGNGQGGGEQPAPGGDDGADSDGADGADGD